MSAGWSADDKEVLRKLYLTHRPFVLRRLLTWTRGDTTVAEDLCHDVFERVLKSYTATRLRELGESRQQALLNTVLINVATDRFRRDGVVSMVRVPAVEDALSAEDHVNAENHQYDRVESQLMLRRFFVTVEKVLSENEYRVVMLGFWVGHPDVEIAELLRTTVATVHTLRSRARKKIKTCVHRDGEVIVFPDEPVHRPLPPTDEREETV
ncbi:RNA polymerase sigma factor [Nocardia takedensis]